MGLHHLRHNTSRRGHHAVERNCGQQSRFFSATGLFGNPGELGGYLALGLVSLSCCLLKQEKRSRTRIFTMLVCTALMLWGIVLADSRTSWLAVGVVVSMHFVIKRTNPAKILLPCALALFIIGIGLFYYRPVSAFVRLQTWEVCGSMFGDALFWGNGTGSFQRLYMDYQTSFLERADSFTRKGADDVFVAYNEFIEYAVEQGIVGLCLLMALLTCVVISLWKERGSSNGRYVLYLLLCACTLAMFSYPASVPSIYVPLIVVLALTPPIGVMEKDRNFMVASAIPSIVFLAFCFTCNVSFWRHYDRYVNLEERPFNLSADTPVSWYVRHHPTFLSLLADSQILIGDHTATITACRLLVAYQNYSQWYMSLGDAYTETGNFRESDTCYERVCKMRPGLMEPFYARFSVWSEIDPKQAIGLARHICVMHAKIENTSTQNMRKVAASYLRNKNMDRSH